MKTLFERLHPEFAEKITDVEFPGIAERLIAELKNEYYVYDLRLEDATQLYKYAYNIYKPFNLLKLYKLFNEIE